MGNSEWVSPASGDHLTACGCPEMGKKKSDRQVKHAGNTETGRVRVYVCAGGARKEGQERRNTQTHVGVLPYYSQGREECGSGPFWGLGFPSASNKQSL